MATMVSSEICAKPFRFRRGSRRRAPAVIFLCAVLLSWANLPAAAKDTTTPKSANPKSANSKSATPMIAAGEIVELELLLAVDCSSSVSAEEYRLQMQGIGQAFRDPAVLAALRSAGANGIAVAVLQWAGVGDQALAVPWTRISNPLQALDFSRQVMQSPRMVEGGPTGLGDALSRAREEVLGNQYSAKRRIIDLSGDGRANQGIHAATARAAAMKAGITVNGLAILNEEKKLDRYYLAGVVGGPNAFLVTAYDYEDFARAIRRKLINEISGSPLTQLEKPPATMGPRAPAPPSRRRPSAASAASPASS
jgi:Mg-chelatase subunit ChlD